MKYRIVCDSSSDLYGLPEEFQDIEFESVPFSIYVGQTEYADTEKLDINAMLADNESSGEKAYTACPSPEDFRRHFEFNGGVLAFTISSGLSGSHNSACTAVHIVKEENPAANIAVIDTKGTGPKTVMLVYLACEMIQQGLAFEEIEAKLNEYVTKSNIIFALCSYRNLMKAGRVNKLVGLIAGRLGIWGIGVGDEHGKIAMCAKATGAKKMVSAMCAEIKKRGLVSRQVFISQCFNEEAALKLKEQLTAMFEQLKVTILPTRGLDSYYAERKGLIVGF